MGVRLEFPQFRPCTFIREATHYLERGKFQPDTHFGDRPAPLLPGEPRAIDLGLPAGLPFVSPDGRYLFFTAGERGKSDIYWVEARFLEETP
jgi:hypothetical protein